MRFYNLSESRIKRILRAPKRIEEGVAPETVAMMQPAGTLKNPYELWAMIENEKTQKKIISVWRYPGKSKPRSENMANIFKQEYSGYKQGK